MNYNVISELESILRAHAAKYPRMMPTDAVKLIYQNEFGGGHLIRDEQACLSYIKSERMAVGQSDGALTEEIGNGIVRVSLSAIEGAGISDELLCRIFVDSAQMISGSLDSLKNKLSVLECLTDEGIFAFSRHELDAYLDEYSAVGYPAVSHSDTYRQLYKPSYRIVLSSILEQHTQK